MDAPDPGELAWTRLKLQPVRRFLTDYNPKPVGLLYRVNKACNDRVMRTAWTAWRSVMFRTKKPQLALQHFRPAPIPPQKRKYNLEDEPTFHVTFGTYNRPGDTQRGATTGQSSFGR